MEDMIEPEVRTWDGTMIYFISKFSIMFLGLFRSQSLDSPGIPDKILCSFPGSELLRTCHSLCVGVGSRGSVKGGLWDQARAQEGDTGRRGGVSSGYIMGQEQECG